MIEMKLFKEANLKGYTLIEAFPGAGLVGSMAGSYMIEKLGMEYVGCIESDEFPPIATIHNGIPMYPARIYKDDRTRFVLVISEFTIPSNSIYQLSREIMGFIRKYGIEKIISISGMPSQKPSDKVFLTSPNPEIIKKASSVGIKAISDGVVAGVSAILLTSANQYKIPVMNLLVEVNPTVMDPKYAETAMEGLNKLLNINIDLTDLDKEAKLVETKIRGLMKKAKDSHETYNNATDAAGPSMYA